MPIAAMATSANAQMILFNGANSKVCKATSDNTNTSLTNPFYSNWFFTCHS